MERGEREREEREDGREGDRLDHSGLLVLRERESEEKE
jgi:hypothetical protein